MLRSCRRTAKHPDTVLVTWDPIVTSLSMKMPKSRTFVDGSTWSAPTRTGVVDRQCWRREVVHQRTSVSQVFSCNLFVLIQSETSSRQADRVDWSWATDPGWQLYGDDPLDTVIGFLRGLFLANHLAITDNLARTTKRQNTQQRKRTIHKKGP